MKNSHLSFVSRLASRVSRLASVSCLASLASALALADVPVTINYTGHIEGADGPLNDKVMLMAFRLYDKPGSGRDLEKMTALWGRQASVTLTDGIFDVDLKDTFGTQLANTQYDALSDALAAAVTAGATDLYIGITPANDSNAEIYPRQRLTPIVKAVQARSVRTIPDTFVATNGTFTSDGPITVKGATKMKGGVSYGATTFSPSSNPTFAGGITVSGTLTANTVSAKTLKATDVQVTTATTTGSATLSSSDKLAASGSVTWSGNIQERIGEITAAQVAGNIGTAGQTTSLPIVDAQTLTASNFVNNSSSNPFYQHEGTWKLLGAWTEGTGISETTEKHNILVYDPRRSGMVVCQSICAGMWKAPSDCFALFQTYVFNRKASDPACVQFFVLDDPNFSSFTSVSPNAIAMLSNGQGSTLKTTVPLILRKGQYVKWLGYNNNKSDGSTIEETDETVVTGIMYQPFGWSN